uniref:Uncharacterized protein n=1 Tax=Anopheles funestus TaxID=62324 RepID=A0A182RD17_ANOFN
MATFRVHEDMEKENRVHALPGGKKNAVLGATNVVPAALGKNVLLPSMGNQQQQQRTMFSVLDNVQNNAGKNVEKTGKDAKLKNQRVGPTSKAGKVGDENAVEAKHNLQTKVQKKPSVSTEAFKGFEIYDETKENLPEVCIPKKVDTIHEKRAPLQELKNAELLETPMSVVESYSPMSVDKSASLIVVDQGPIPRNDRERFFEVEEYQEDILVYLKEAEKRNRPKPGYMLKQTDITYSMRTILVDWLVEVSDEYKLQGETLALAVSYIDRFLSFMSVVRAKLQLVGTAAMFIAAKYEEIYPPDVSEFVYITDDTYTKTQVLRMEQLMLKVLSFDLTVPTSLVFINSYCVMNDVPDKVKYLAMVNIKQLSVGLSRDDLTTINLSPVCVYILKYLCELSLLEADPYLTYKPSKIAAGALALARRALDLPMWSKMLENNTGYTLQEMKDIIMDLNKTHIDAATMQPQAIQEKYKSKTYHEVATIPATELPKNTLDNMCEITVCNASASALLFV